MNSLPTVSTEGALDAPAASVIGASQARALRHRELVFVAGAIGVFLRDQLTKSVAVQHLWPLGSVQWAGILCLTYVENRGVLQKQALLFVASSTASISPGGLHSIWPRRPSWSGCA